MWWCAYERDFVHVQYDINQDGLLEFVLTTTDAEIVFVQTDNKLLHGETIKVCVCRR